MAPRACEHTVTQHGSLTTLTQTDEELSHIPVYHNIERTLRQLTRIRIIADTIWVGSVYATQALTWEDGYLRQYGGLIHGRNIQDDCSAYARGAALQHALQTIAHWPKNHDPTVIQHITIGGGGYRAIYHFQNWMEKGRASLECPVVSDVLGTMNNISENFQGSFAIIPLSLPETEEEGGRTNLYHQMAHLLADPYEQFALLAVPLSWRTSPRDSPPLRGS